MGLQVFLRHKALETDTAHATIHFDSGMLAQVDAVVVHLAEALSAFSTTVRARSCVQVHVLLQLEAGGQMKAADGAVEIPGLCGQKEREH